MTANDPQVNPPLNDTQKAALYAELASGAETGKFVSSRVIRIGSKVALGWDYTKRWFTDGDNDGSLRNLGVRSLVAVDLNSILCEYGHSFVGPLF